MGRKTRIRNLVLKAATANTTLMPFLTTVMPLPTTVKGVAPKAMPPPPKFKAKLKTKPVQKTVFEMRFDASLPSDLARPQGLAVATPRRYQQLAASFALGCLSLTAVLFTIRISRWPSSQSVLGHSGLLSESVTQTMATN